MVLSAQAANPVVAATDKYILRFENYLLYHGGGRGVTLPAFPDHESKNCCTLSKDCLAKKCWMQKCYQYFSKEWDEQFFEKKD
jgi:hypothetical protein